MTMATTPQPHHAQHHAPAHPAHLRVAKAEPVRIAHLLNLPNAITLIRVAMIPVFLSLLSRNKFHEALYVFAAAALTDSFDGTLARMLNQRTEIGAFLDPFADKLMVVSAFVVLTVTGELPGYLLSVVAVRDIVVVTGYVMMSFFTAERIPVTPSYLGKASTFLQLACVIAALSQFSHAYPSGFTQLLYATVLVTALSGVHYAYRGLVLLQSREPEMFEGTAKKPR